MEGDKAFTARLARGDSQSRGAIGVGVEAIQLQAADLVAACSAPAGNHQGGPLKWVGKLVDRGHQLCQFMIGNETWHSPRHLRQVPSPQQRSGRTIGPAPTDDVGAKHRYRREHAALGHCRQRSTGLAGAQWMTTSIAGGLLEVGGECQRVIAGDVCPLDDLGVAVGHEFHEPAKAQLEFDHRGWPRIQPAGIQIPRYDVFHPGGPNPPTSVARLGH